MMSLLCCVLQIRVSAYDSASPSQRVTAVVVVTVSRNENGPRFSHSTYSAEASHDAKLGDLVTTVNATDADQVGTTDTPWGRGELRRPGRAGKLTYPVNGRVANRSW